MNYTKCDAESAIRSKILLSQVNDWTARRQEMIDIGKRHLAHLHRYCRKLRGHRFKLSCILLVFFTSGMDKTIQRGDLGKHGILFKIVPMHSEMKPSDNDFMSCWYKPLPKWLPRAGQSVIPTNLSEFKVC